MTNTRPSPTGEVASIAAPSTVPILRYFTVMPGWVTHGVYGGASNAASATTAASGLTGASLTTGSEVR